MVPFLHWIVTKKRPQSHHIVCVFLCLAGVGILSLSGGWGMSAGDILTVLSGIPCAMNMVITAIVSRDRNVLLLTTIDKTLLRSGLDWIGTPNIMKLTNLLEEKSDLLILMIDNGDFPIEFLSKCTKARFKVGRRGFKGHAFDLIVSGATNEDLRSDSRKIFQEITEFLLKIR
jgi:hypothetical protein